MPPQEPLGVCFSGGVDSGAVFLLTYHALLQRGDSPARLKAFTLAVDGGGPDLEQARDFLRRLGLELFLEAVPVRSAEVSVEEAVRAIEDYKPLDVQAAAMALALCRGIRQRYPAWKYLLDGGNDMLGSADEKEICDQRWQYFQVALGISVLCVDDSNIW